MLASPEKWNLPNWAPITQNSTVDNLRPIIAPGDPLMMVILWMRGVYRSYVDYSAAAGLIDEN